MPISVELQNPFSYSFLLTVILIAIVLLPVIIYLIYKLIHYKPKKRVRKQAKPKPVKPKKINVAEVKGKYVSQISIIENRHKRGEIDDRTAYIELSSAVRNFVHEVTGIDAQNFTLNEIKKLNMPQLHTLIEKFYRPEFSYEDSTSDINQAFKDARTVVSQWK